MRRWLGVLVGGAVVVHGCGGKTGASDTSDEPSAASAGRAGGANESIATSGSSTTTAAGGIRATTMGTGAADGTSRTSGAGGDRAVVSSGSGDGGTAGAVGAGSTNVGFYCPNPYADSPLYCNAGQHCATCVIGDDLGYRCVPSQTHDPEGFESGTADCDRSNPIIECDGPEDCFDGEYCVTDGPTRCASEPLFGSCCLYCDAPPQCTYCRDNQDCGEAGVCVDEPLLGEEIDACAPKPCDDDEQCPADYICVRSRCRREE